MNGQPAGPAVDWARWSVVLLKPDCVERGLVDPVLQRVEAELCLVAVETVTVADWQIFTHYWDLFVYRHHLGVDVAGCLRSRYIGHQVVIALGHGRQPGTRRDSTRQAAIEPARMQRDHDRPGLVGPDHAGPGSAGADISADGEGLDTPTRVRALLGHFDPSQARPGTIRADFGADSLTVARREHRLVDNLIHSSDDDAAAWRDFHIWFGGHRATELLTDHDPVTCPTEGARSAFPTGDTLPVSSARSLSSNDTAAAPSAAHATRQHVPPTEVSDA